MAKRLIIKLRLDLWFRLVSWIEHHLIESDVIDASRIVDLCLSLKEALTDEG